MKKYCVKNLKKIEITSSRTSSVISHCCGGILAHSASVHWGLRGSRTSLWRFHHFSQVEDWTLTGPLQHPHFWISWCVRSHRPSAWPTFSQTLAVWSPDEFTITSMSVRCIGPVSVDQAQVINLPPPCLTVGVKCLYWYAVWFWSVKMTSCGLFRENIGNHAAMSERQSFLLEILPSRSYLSRHFYFNVTTINVLLLGIVLTNTWMFQTSELQKKVCFYKGAHRCSWSINLVDLISSTWLTLKQWGSA